MFILDMNGCGHYYFTVRCCEGALAYTHRYRGESLIFSMYRGSVSTLPFIRNANQLGGSWKILPLKTSWSRNLRIKLYYFLFFAYFHVLHGISIKNFRKFPGPLSPGESLLTPILGLYSIGSYRMVAPCFPAHTIRTICRENLFGYRFS